MSYRTSVYNFVEKYKNHKLVQNFLLAMYHESLLHIELKGEFESNHQCQFTRFDGFFFARSAE